MNEVVPSEPSLQHQISTGVQYYIPGGHSDRRGRGELCTGRGKSLCIICVCIWTEKFVETHKLYTKTVQNKTLTEELKANSRDLMQVTWRNMDRV